MATTFKDFIIECELYPYSRENFEFMKECKEIELTHTFINSQIFMSESMNKLRNSSIKIEENFFNESVDDYNLEILTESLNTKMNNIVYNIIKKISKIFNVFKNFFGKIGNKFDPITKKGQVVLKKLNSMTLNDQAIDVIDKIIDKAKKTDSSAFPIKSNQPFAKNIKFKYDGTRDITKLKNDLAVALSDSKVIAEALFSDSEDKKVDKQRIGIMDPDELCDAATNIYIGKKSAIMNVCNSLYNSWKYVKANGLEINVNTKNINNTAKRLNDLCDKINDTFALKGEEIQQSYAINREKLAAANAAVNAVDNNIDSKGSNTINGIGELLKNIDAKLPESNDIIQIMNEAQLLLTSTIGLTTKVYVQLNGYRQLVINNLYNILTKDNNKGNDNDNSNDNK